MSQTADGYEIRGRTKEAKDLRVQVVERRKNSLWAGHPDTLNGMDQLIHTYELQGCTKEAEDLRVQVVEIKQKRLALEHSESFSPPYTFDTLILRDPLSPLENPEDSKLLMAYSGLNQSGLTQSNDEATTSTWKTRFRDRLLASRHSP
ncbi:hypothetical protein MMC22_011178 [Lobaria immixta]|nr:hypothetical protein [Lobaria immixta]